jgi:hypothetical protein
MDAGATRPWMVEGRTMQELLSRVTQEQFTELATWHPPFVRRFPHGLEIAALPLAMTLYS